MKNPLFQIILICFSLFGCQIIDYSFLPGSVGTTVKMNLEIKNGTLIIKGPVKEDGTIDERNNFIEKYVRLD